MLWSVARAYRWRNCHVHALSGGKFVTNLYQLQATSFSPFGDRYVKTKERQAQRLPPVIPYSQGRSLLSLASNTVECTVQPNRV